MSASTPVDPQLAKHTSEVSQLLTAEQVAARWQCAPEHVHRLSREDKLAVVKLGRWRRWRLADVETFEAEGGAE